MSHERIIMGRFWSHATVDADTYARAGATFTVRCTDRFLAYRAGQRVCIWKNDEWVQALVQSYSVASGDMMLVALEACGHDESPSVRLFASDRDICVDLCAPRGPPGKQGPAGATTSAPFICATRASDVTLVPGESTALQFSRVLYEDVPCTFAHDHIVAQPASFLAIRVSFKCKAESECVSQLIVRVDLTRAKTGKADRVWSFVNTFQIHQTYITHTFPLVRASAPGDTLHVRVESHTAASLRDIYVYVEC